VVVVAFDEVLVTEGVEYDIVPVDIEGDVTLEDWSEVLPSL
jgi:hypothetical protein